MYRDPPTSKTSRVARREVVTCPVYGRSGYPRLSLVQLATEQEVYLFDVAVGGSAIVEPLKTLLGSQDVVNWGRQGGAR